MGDLVIGIDSSTTATKAIAWDRDGRAVAEGRADIPMSRPRPHFYEQDPGDWWGSTAQALRHVTAQVDAARIAAVAISNQRETLGTFRRTGEPSCPATVWLDERSGATYRDLARAIGTDPDGTATQHRISGKPVDVIPAVTRIDWMRKHAPDLHAATEIFSDVHGYLTFRLTGEWATSWASADPSGVFDLAAKRWSPEIMAAVGIDAGRLCRAERPGTVLGQVTAGAAEATGLRAATPVIAGGGDGQMAGLGCAALDSRTAYLNIGTALVSGIHGTDYRTSQSWRTMGGPSGEGYYYESCVRAGTFTVTWFLETFFAGDTTPPARILAQLEQDCRDIPIGALGLVMLPYWQGVMAPYWDNTARGTFIGLSGAHGRAHMFRALMEGLALETRLCTAAAEDALGTPFDRFIAIGGGAASEVWRQIFADATGKTVERSDTVEASSLGAAMCAAVAAGWYGDFAAASAAMSGRIVSTATPDPAAHERYTALFDLYRRVYGQVQPLFQGLEDFAGAAG